jgi:hypothetical protein
MRVTILLRNAGGAMEIGVVAAPHFLYPGDAQALGSTVTE